MINLGTTAALQLILAAAATLDVVPSWVDYTQGATVSVPGGTPLAVTASGATTIVPANGNANTIRNVKSVFIRNKGASTATITVVVDVGGTDYEVRKVSLPPGAVLIYDDGAPWCVAYESSAYRAVATADQALTAAAANLINGSVLDATSLKVGTILKWVTHMSKTGAGTAAQTFDVRFGTNGGTADTVRVGTGSAFTTGVQTTNADVAEVEVRVTIRSVSAAGTCHGVMELGHNLSATGFAPTPEVVIQQTPAAFDMTTAGLKASLCTTPGTGAAVTVHQCEAERLDP